MNYNSVVLYNPAISSMNMGDHIIGDSVKKQIEPIIKNDFLIEVSSHLPISRMYTRHFKNSKYKFVGGSNLLRGKMNRLFRQWDIRFDQVDLIKDSILVGVGWWQYNDEPNFYTKLLYNNILSKNFLHSVRDEFTKEKLAQIGINNVINTACATMWSLTPDHVSQIKNTKANSVVFTLTDYNQDFERDSKMIDVLLKNYQNVYFWLQGLKDVEYMKKLNIENLNIKVIPPKLELFDKILEIEDMDYVGTRLHGGIRALQHQKRTLIIGVDNRAIEKKKDFNLDVLNRDEIDKLEDVINKKIDNEIKIPQREIELWKSQFV